MDSYATAAPTFVVGCLEIQKSCVSNFDHYIASSPILTMPKFNCFLVFCLLLLFSGVSNITQAGDAKQGAAHKPQKVQPAAARGIDTTAIDAIVAKYRTKREDARKEKHKAVKILLDAGVPSDPVLRKKWRADLRAALKAEREAVDAVDQARQKELDADDRKRHPNDDDEG